MKTGIQIISEERDRQIFEELFSDNRDDGYVNGELSSAAACYAMKESYNIDDGYDARRLFEWPWDLSWWKPSPENRIQELAKAGALIAAEIDRLRRLKDNEIFNSSELKVHREPKS